MYLVVFVLCFFLFPSVLWHCWLGLLTCKNRLPYNLHCVGGDVKHCTTNQPQQPTVKSSYMYWGRQWLFLTRSICLSFWAAHFSPMHQWWSCSFSSSQSATCMYSIVLCQAVAVTWLTNTINMLTTDYTSVHWNVTQKNLDLTVTFCYWHSAITSRNFDMNK